MHMCEFVLGCVCVCACVCLCVCVCGRAIRVAVPETDPSSGPLVTDVERVSC